MSLICCGYANYNAQEAFVIIFIMCSGLHNCLRSLCTVAINTENKRKKEKKKKKILTASSLFAVLMCFLYDHLRNSKFTTKYQQHGPCFQTTTRPLFSDYNTALVSRLQHGRCFQTIFPFLMTNFLRSHSFEVL